MKPVPGFSIGPEDYVYDEDSRELLEGMEGASVQEKLMDTDFFNNFEVCWDGGLVFRPVEITVAAGGEGAAG